MSHRDEIGPAALQALLSRRQLSDAPVILLGMHRSGTTLLAQILDAAGVYMGSRLSGNHEPRLFQDANRHALDFFGCSWCRVDGLPSASALKLGYASLVNALGERLVQDIEHGFLDGCETTHTQWGWKDPRNCLTAPLYLRLFPQARAFFIFRRARAVVDSMLTRNRRLLAKNPLPDGPRDIAGALDERAAYALWDLYNSRALEVLPCFRQAIAVCYEDLVDSPGREIARVLDELRFDAARPPSALAAMVRRAGAPTPAGVRDGDAGEEPREAVEIYRRLRARTLGQMRERLQAIMKEQGDQGRVYGNPRLLSKAGQ